MINNLEGCEIGCGRYSAYDYDGLSLQELLCQFFTKINECINDVNKYTEMVKDMLEWIHNEGLEKEVVQQLNKWLADGTLANIINKTIFKELNDKVDYIYQFNGDNLQTDLNTKKRLFIKEGLYEVSGTLTCTNQDLKLIQGEKGKTILKLQTGADKKAGILKVEGLNNILIDGIVFDGNGENRCATDYYHGGGAGKNPDMDIVDVEFINCSNLIISNCIFKEAIYGSIRLKNCKNVTFEKNIILSSYGHGLIVDKSYESHIHGNNIYEAGKKEKYPYGLNGCGIAFIDQYAQTDTSHENVVTNNIIVNCREAGISYEGHRRVISNNIILNSGQQKAAIKSMSHRIDTRVPVNNFRRKQHLITGNMVIGSLNETRANIGIHAVGSDVLIADNFIFNRGKEDFIKCVSSLSKENLDSPAIYAQSLHDTKDKVDFETRNIKISNNFIKNINGRGIYTAGGSGRLMNIVINDNMITNTQDAGICTVTTENTVIKGNNLTNCCNYSKDKYEKPMHLIDETKLLNIDGNTINFNKSELPKDAKLVDRNIGNLQVHSMVDLPVLMINNNTITSAGNHGILLTESCKAKHVTLKNNLIEFSTTDRIEFVTGVFVKTDTADGIKNFIATENTFINATNRGLYLNGINEGKISDNYSSASENDQGIIYLNKDCKNLFITGNKGSSIGSNGTNTTTIQNNFLMGNMVASWGFIDPGKNNVRKYNNIDA